MNWIKLSDWLPEYDIPILTYDKKYPSWIQLLMRYEDSDGWSWAGLDIFGSNINDPGSYVMDGEYTCTHWMYLPKPPQEKE